MSSIGTLAQNVSEWWRPNVSAEISTLLYGLGWARVSYTGHNVSEMDASPIQIHVTMIMLR
jgi:hypothetical protein